MTPLSACSGAGNLMRSSDDELRKEIKEFMHKKGISPLKPSTIDEVVIISRELEALQPPSLWPDKVNLAVGVFYSHFRLKKLNRLELERMRENRSLIREVVKKIPCGDLLTDEEKEEAGCQVVSKLLRELEKE